VLSAATVDALLFEDDKFSEDQNKLVYLLSSDPHTNTKTQNQSLYLGHIGVSESEIISDLNSQSSAASWKKILPDFALNYAVDFVDPAQKAKYEKYVSVDQVTGILTITNPVDVILPETEKLVMVQLRVTMASQYTSLDAPMLFFLHTNKLFKATMQSDISLALTNTNSISFYGQWFYVIK